MKNHPTLLKPASMHKIYLLYLLSLTATLKAQTLIKNVNLIDVEGKKIIRDQDIASVNGKILYVGKGHMYKMPPGTEVIDGKGKFLIPGYTDAHVHFFQSGGLFTRPDAIDLRKYKPYNDEIKWVHDHMKDFLTLYLKAGITSVIDVGASFNFLQQRDTFLNKPNSPLIYMTGPLLTSYVPEEYEGLGSDAPFIKMTSEEDTRQSVRDQLKYKPDFIKIWFIVLDSNIERGARTNLKFVEAAIDEAHKNHLRVAVHATERITAQLAVIAGADYLVHNVDNELITDAFVQLLKNKHTVLCPTLIVSHNYGKVFSGNYRFTDDEIKHSNPEQVATIKNYPQPDTITGDRLINIINRGSYFKRQKTTDSISAVNLKKLIDAGVTIASGTDAGNIGTQHAGSYFNELKAMQGAGLSLWQIMVASTINGARSIGKEHDFGSIKQGKAANMVLLNSNPLEKLDNFKDIDVVINRGAVYTPE
ncbi:MAG: amidohydrolase family protein [Flavitalea sp.]